MYEKLLQVNTEEARRIESMTKWYAYAYQVLGSLYFCKRADETLEDLLPEYERILFKDSYDLVWKSLSNGETRGYLKFRLPRFDKYIEIWGE